MRDWLGLLLSLHLVLKAQGRLLTFHSLPQIMHLQPWMRHRHYIRRPIYILLSWLLYFQVATGVGSTLVYQIMK